ncbi:hypothetical protein GGR55DRAFT_40647 [Xylaria sp. FL0064]|nr:hypothetical protein GGR55DRAFT_40647 [Xylaria sp. FL0064]
MALKQDSENGVLSGQNISTNNVSSTPDTSMEGRLIEGRRRLAEIVGQGFEAFDSCVYDLPDSPINRYRRRYADNECSYYMSGALVASSPTQIKSSPSVIDSADEVGEDLVYPHLPFGEPSVSSFGPVGHDTMTSRYFPHYNLKHMNGCHNKAQMAESSLNQIELDKHQSQADQDQNRTTPVHINNSSRIWVSSDRPHGVLGEVRGKCNGSDQSSARTSPQVHQNSSRRETPIPAPQP